MKVYHTHNGIFRYMVAAKNQKEAARLLNTTVGGLRLCGGVYTKPEVVAIALSEPGRVFKQDMRQGVYPWIYADGGKQ